jgi:enoyl-CoA hydratase/carnithine racemase
MTAIDLADWHGHYNSTQVDGHLLIITINRPEVYNALHPDAGAELSSIFDQFQNTDDLWVAIITGAGSKAFCAGFDLKWVAATGGKARVDASGFGGLTSRFTLNKPIIAAVNGVAMGGGFELALACDLIVAAESARFALPEVKVGQLAGAGGVHRLPRMIPQKLAMGMVLTGRHVSAQEGAAMGFVNEVVPDGEALAGARRWAELILANSPMAVRATLEQAKQGLNIASLQTAISTPWPATIAMEGCHDEIEGPRAFAEKRKPEWKLG